jgi:ABC-2 type transport system ATP-binding protein
MEDLRQALSASGLTVNTSGGALRTDADPALVGQIAWRAGLALSELRAAETTGLEEIFLALTADTQREGAAA